MNPPSPSRSARTAACAALALASLILTPLVGAVPLDFSLVLAGDPTQASVFWTLRLPRVLLAAMTGATLAASGAAFQAVFRNDLASPFTLGLASGASLGAVIAIHLGLTGTLLGFSPLPIAGFIGALTVVFSVFSIIRSLGSRGDASTILLAGVTISFLCSALILLLQYLSDMTGTNRMIRWMMGGLDTVGYEALWQSGPLVVAGLAFLIARATTLNHLMMGDLLAASRGIRVGRERALVLLAGSMAAGAVIAFTGPIGFVGLIVPHTARRIVGSDHRWLVPTSLLLGAAFLPVCDMVARTIIAPSELPVGILTALLGAPFFLVLLVQGKVR